MESRTKNSIRNIISGVINKSINIIFPFVVRTIFIQKLGSEFLGLNSLFVSILQVLNLTELGFGSALVYSMYKPIAENDTDKINILLNYYKKCYRIIGIIILIVGLIICPFIGFFIKDTIPNNNIYISFLIYLINTVLSYLFFSYKSSLFIANQRNDLINNINTIVCIIQNTIQLLVLMFFSNYYVYIIVLPIMTWLRNLYIHFFSKKYYPQNIPMGNLDKIDKDEITKNVKGMIFQKIGYIILANVDSIVISAFLGLNILGVYNNYYYIITAILGIVNIIMDSLKASVGNSIIKESVDKNFRDFKMLNFIYTWIVTWCSICLMCLLHNFIILWLGEEFILDKMISISLAIYFFIYKWCDMTYVYQEAKGLWWENRYIPLLGGLLNLILNVILVNYIGLYGIIYSTIISLLLVNNIGFAYILFKYYFKEKKYMLEYIFNQFLYIVIFGGTAFVTYSICNILENTIRMFIFKMVICITIPNILLFIFYCKNNCFRQTLSFVKNTVLKGKQ